MSLKKHFYFFTNNDFSLSGGGSVRMIGIIEALAIRGHNVTLLSNSKERNIFPQKVRHISINKYLNKNERRKIQFVLAIIPSIFVKIWFKRFCRYYDHIFTENSLSNKEIIFFEYFDNALAYLFKECGLLDCSINDIHGVAPLEFRYKKQTNVTGTIVNYTKYILSKSLDNKINNSVDGIIVLNQLLKNYFINEYPFLKKKRIYLVSDGISKSLMTQEIDYSLIEDLKNKYQIGKKTKIVSFMGSFKNFGGVTDLVNAFIKIHNNYDLKLMLIGDGEEYNKVINIIEKNGVSNKVILLGRTPYKNLKSYQMLSDIIVCPDIRHPFTDMVVHTKYFESLYSGKVVINGNFRSLSKMNKNERLSLSFEPSDIDDLAYKLTFALNNLEALTVKYKQNTTIVSKSYSYEASINGLI